jgi:hypothetical protein
MICLLFAEGKVGCHIGLACGCGFLEATLQLADGELTNRDARYVIDLRG